MNDADCEHGVRGPCHICGTVEIVRLTPAQATRALELCRARLATAEREREEARGKHKSELTTALDEQFLSLNQQFDAKHKADEMLLAESRGKLALAVEALDRWAHHCYPRQHVPAIRWLYDEIVEAIARIRGDK